MRASGSPFSQTASGDVIQNCTVWVYEPGTTTPIAQTMYSAPSGGVVLANPLTTDAHGVRPFYVANGQRVDYYYVPGGGLDPYTQANQPVSDDPSQVVKLAGLAGAIGGLSGIVLDAPVLNDPTIDGGTLANFVLDTPTITDGTADGLALSAPAITDGTATGLTLSGAKNAGLDGVPALVRSRRRITPEYCGADGKAVIRADGRWNSTGTTLILDNGVGLPYLGKKFLLSRGRSGSLPLRGTVTAVGGTNNNTLTLSTAITQAPGGGIGVGTEEVVFGEDDTAAWAAMLAEIKAESNGGLVEAYGQYLVDRLALSTMKGVVIEGALGGLGTASGGVVRVYGSALIPFGHSAGDGLPWLDWGNNADCELRGFSIGCSLGIEPVIHSFSSLLKIGFGGGETTNNLLERLYIRQRASVAAIYIAGGVSQLEMRQVIAYQNYEGATTRALWITANNQGAQAGNGYTQSAAANIGDIRCVQCQFHEASVAAGAGVAQTRSVYLDGVWRLRLEDCNVTPTSTYITINDSDPTNRPTRNLKLDTCVFDADPPRSPAVPPQLIDIVSSGNVDGLTILNSYIKTAGGTEAMIKGASGTTISRILMMANQNVLPTPVILSFAGAGIGSNRILGRSMIDLMGGSATLNGGASGETEWANGTVSAGSGGDRIKGPTLGANGYTQLPLAGDILDANGKPLISPNPVASSDQRLQVTNGRNGVSNTKLEVVGSGNGSLELVPLGTGDIRPAGNIVQTNANGYVRPGGVSPGTPTANAAYQNSVPKVEVGFTSAATPVVQSDPLNVATSGAVSRGGAGIYTITFTRAFANTEYRVDVTPQSNTGCYGYAVDAGKSTTSVQVQVRKGSDDSLFDPTLITVRCWGQQ